MDLRLIGGRLESYCKSHFHFLFIHSLKLKIKTMLTNYYYHDYYLIIISSFCCSDFSFVH